MDPNALFAMAQFYFYSAFVGLLVVGALVWVVMPLLGWAKWFGKELFKHAFFAALLALLWPHLRLLWDDAQQSALELLRAWLSRT